MKILSTLALISLSASLASAQAPTPPPALDKKTKSMLEDYVGQLASPLKPSATVAYKHAANGDLLLHIFNPEGWQATDKRACYVTIHGGGWTGGAPIRMYSFADHYAKLGLVGISVQYRLHSAKTGVSVFDCVKDARSALRYIRGHAAELGIDPEKIIVSGGSAGGHLAASTAMFEGVDDPRDNKAISPTPNALILLFPVIDTSKEGYGNEKVGEKWQEISPAHQVRAGLPPTLTFHSTGDTVTPFKGAQVFHDAMLKAGNRSELVVNEGGAHGYLMRTQALYEECLQKSDAFLKSLELLK